MATGVLPVFVGRATRAVEFASEGDKEYLAGLRLGTVTDTQDTSGRVLEEHPCLSDWGRIGGGAGPLPGRDSAAAPHVLRHQGKREEALRAGP